MLVNDRWELSRNKGKRDLKSTKVVNTHMFVRSRGVWFGFAEKMFILFGDIQKTCFLTKVTVILLYIHLRVTAGHYGFLRRPGSSCFRE